MSRYYNTVGENVEGRWVSLQYCNPIYNANFLAYMTLDGKALTDADIGKTMLYPVDATSVEKAKITGWATAPTTASPSIVPMDYRESIPCVLGEYQETYQPPITTRSEIDDLVNQPPITTGNTQVLTNSDGSMPDGQPGGPNDPEAKEHWEKLKDTLIKKGESKPKIPMYVWYFAGAVVLIMVGKKQKWF
tara:strand:+ start:663 stop:1232 length:570 start_codon:yes stop_codon:yes gene_type:complete